MLLTMVSPQELPANPAHRIGGFYTEREGAASAADLLDFDVFMAQDGDRYYLVPAAMVNSLLEKKGTS